jgi:hypothetical protein
MCVAEGLISCQNSKHGLMRSSRIPTSLVKHRRAVEGVENRVYLFQIIINLSLLVSKLQFHNMIEIDPDPTEESLYVCRACGTGVDNTGHEYNCPHCGGLLRNTTVAHD